MNEDPTRSPAGDPPAKSAQKNHREILRLALIVLGIVGGMAAVWFVGRIATNYWAWEHPDRPINVVWPTSFWERGQSLSTSLLESSLSVEDAVSTADGGYAVARTNYPDGMNSPNQIHVVRIDAQGKHSWEFFNHSDKSQFSDLVRASKNGDVVVAGISYDVDEKRDHRFVFLRLDPTGKLVWVRESSQVTGGQIKDFLVTDDGYVFAGNTRAGRKAGDPLIPGRDLWIEKLDESGDRVWEFRLDEEISESLTALVGTSDSGFIAVGTLGAQPFTKSEGIVIRLDREGRLLWKRRISTKNPHNRLDTVIELSDRGILVGGKAGEFAENDRGVIFTNSDGWLASLDSKGNTVWQRTYGGKKTDEISVLLEIGAGQIFAAGINRSKFRANVEADIGPGSSGQPGYLNVRQLMIQWDQYGEIWLFKVDSEGRIVKTFDGPNWDFVFQGASYFSNHPLALARGPDNEITIIGISEFSRDYGVWTIAVDSNGAIR